MVGPENRDAFRRLAQSIFDDTSRASGACGTATDPGDWLTARRRIQEHALAAPGEPGLPPGCLLVADLPGLCSDCVEGWLGKRVFVVSSDVSCRRRRLSFVSSRLGQKLHSRDLRIDAFRTGVLRTDSRHELLLTSKGTSCELLVRRAAELFGAPILEVVVADDDESPDDWWRSIPSRIRDDGGAGAIFVSPELALEGATDLAAAASPMHDVPLRDRLLFALAQRITVLHARRDGIAETLSESHLADGHRRKTPLLMVMPEAAVQPTARGEPNWQVAQRLVECGAIAWRLAGGDSEMSDDPEPVSASGSGPAVPIGAAFTCEKATVRPVEDGPLACPELWLSHWTRAIHGAWPDEDEHAFVDHLLLGEVLQTRTQLLSLIRILRCGVLYGSARLLKGDQPMVSFTQRPLSEFRALRTWRRHLRRYDFETRGICVRRSLLEDLGAKPVAYVDEASPGERDPGPFVHPSGRNDEWVEEQEWRLVGDLNLENLDANDLCVFTDSADEAEIVRCFCEFHVVVLP